MLHISHCEIMRMNVFTGDNVPSSMTDDLTVLHHSVAGIGWTQRYLVASRYFRRSREVVLNAGPAFKEEYA
jgi:hypothetical protein